MQSLKKFKNKKIFISGGAGIIGKELVKKLCGINNKIFVGDFKTKPKCFGKNIKYRKGDLNSFSFKELSQFNPDIIFHLAATYERTHETFNFYNNNFSNNIKLSNHLLKNIKKLKKLKAFIFASSYLVYDEKLYLKKNSTVKSLRETDQKDTRNLIGSSKYYHEKEIEFFSNYLPNCKFVVARIFRGYGLNSRDIISRWIRMAIQKRELKVFGENGSFDYIFSKDSANALLSTIECKKGITYLNIGSGKSVKIKKIIQILKKYFPKLRVKKINKKINVENSKANIDRIKRLTNWKPNYSIELGIDEIVKYEKKKTNKN